LGCLPVWSFDIGIGGRLSWIINNLLHREGY
jgi:hypothetical protein